MFCVQCGRELGSEAQFCCACGKSVIIYPSKKEVTAQEGVELLPVEQTTEEGSSKSNNQEYKDLIVALGLENVTNPAIFVSASVDFRDISESVASALLDDLVNIAEDTSNPQKGYAKTAIGKMLIGRYGETEKGLNMLMAAAEAEEPIAQNILGGWYFNEENKEYDLDKAVYWFKKSAENGYSKSQDMLSSLYWSGNGVAVDYQKSDEYLIQAATNGKPESQYRLGLRYIEGGYGINANQEVGLQWIEKATQKGLLEAHYYLANHYYDTNNKEKAFLHYINAAEADYMNSQLISAMMMRDGEGTPQNPLAALEMFKKAANSEDCNKACIAQKELGCMMNDVFGDIAEAAKWWEQAANNGNLASQYNLAIIYTYGEKNIPVNAQKAEYWFNKVREQDHSDINDEDLISIYKRIMYLKLTDNNN